jgi:hypothetical protein
MTSNMFELDDNKLVEKFVQGSNQLLASANLRLEVNGGLSQLMARTGDPVAIMYLQNKPRTAIVKHSSQFLTLIDRVLIDRDFVMFGDANRVGFIEYRSFVTPAGYQIFYTDPSILWKKWWPTEKFQDKQRFNMDILVGFKNNWYPVQSILVNAGTYTIKTIAGQLVLKREGKILWLAQRVQAQQALEPQNIPAASSVAPAKISFNAQGYAELASAGLAKKIQQKQSKVDPDRVHSIIKELEQKLQSQIDSNQKIEAKYHDLEQRAMIAEQRLQVICKFLTAKGINQQDIFRIKE